MPTGRRSPASGAFGNLRQLLVAGLYATPSENASPQQPPPQPSISLPVQTTALNPSCTRRSGELGSCGQVFAAGSEAGRVPCPPTSTSLPVQTELRCMKPEVSAGGESLRHVLVLG